MRIPSFLFLGLACCAQYGSVDMTPNSLPPEPAEAEFTQSEVVLSVGAAASVQTEALTKQGEPLQSEYELVSADPDVLQVYPGIDENTYVLTGVATGTTSLLVRMGTDVEDRIHVDVVEQL
jgi:hypothetical protein